MKKLLIMAAVVCVAVVAQAASITWSTVAMFDNTGNGTYVAKNATLFVYSVTSLDGLEDMASIWKTYGADVLAGGKDASILNAGGTVSRYGNSASVSQSDTVKNTSYYAAAIITYKSGDDLFYYAESKQITTDDGGDGAWTFGVDKLDSAAAAKNAWVSTSSSNVPEPTSGLLLLVGMGALALRRKRA